MLTKIFLKRCEVADFVQIVSRERAKIKEPPQRLLFPFVMELQMCRMD
jgi:hypothetical protein